MKIPLNVDLSKQTQRTLIENGKTYGPYSYDANGAFYNPEVKIAQASGDNTPNYWKLRKQGKIIPSNYYTRKDYLGESEATWTCYKNGVLYSRWTWSNGPASHISKWRYNETTDLLPFSSDPEVQEEQAYRLQQAASKIYSSGWDALTFIGELKDTVRMFRGMKERYANDIANILRKVDSLRNPRYRGKFRTAKDIHDILANGYLEGRYGWRTLGYDLQDIAKALARIDSKRQRFRESVPGTAVKTATSGTENWSWAFCYGQHRWQKDHSFQPRALIVADIQPPKLSFNPLVTGWELAPLSFVVDRFVNVGQYLESMSFLALATTWTGSVSYIYEMESTQEIVSLKWLSPYTGTYTTSGSASVKVIVRHPMNNLPIHPLAKIRMDLWFGLDLIELVAQRLKAPRKTIAMLLDSYRGR